MGNHRFRLSDMMPNSWFHKLKDMSSKPRKKLNTPKKKKQLQQPPTFASPTKCTQPSKPKQLVPHHHHHHLHHHHQCHPRQSYYFTRELTTTTPGPRLCHSFPTNSKPSDTNFPAGPPSKQKPNSIITKKPSSDTNLVTSSVSAGCGCRTSVESVCTKPDSPPELWSSSSFDSSPEPEFRCDRVLTTETFDGMLSLSSSSCAAAYQVDNNCTENDVVIDVDKASLSLKLSDLPDNGLDSFSELELPPIKTKPAKFSEMVRDVKKKKKTASSVRRVSTTTSSPGVKLRTNSPRIGNRKINQANLSRRSVSSNSSSKRRSSVSDTTAFAIVKSSCDPQRDFRESMVEMIMENNIKASKDLEDLLACYLSLNADEYHELIIKVFKQIWFDLTDISSK